MAKRMEFIFGDVAMTLSPADIESVLAEWQRPIPARI